MPPIQHLPLAVETASMMHAFAKASGLDSLAEWIEGDNFVVCDLGVHGVEGCATVRAAIAQQHLVAEWVSLGVCLLVAVLVGSLATAFVTLLARAIGPMPRRCQVTLPAPANDDRAGNAAAA